MSDWPWVIIAYTLTWLVLGVYALRLRRRLDRARTDLEEETQQTGGSPEVGHE